jgi:hypothetical protein
MTKTPTLDKRIAAALAETNADNIELAGLVYDAITAKAEAEETVKIESENELDLSNTDPDASSEKVWKAERTVARLSKAILALQARIAAIEARDAAASWHAQADKVEAERDKIATELAELYPTFMEKLIDIFERIDANNAAINNLYRSAQWGYNDRQIVDAELAARGLQSYSAHQPALRDNIKLPFWDESSRTYPADALAEWNARAAASAAATARALEAKRRPRKIAGTHITRRATS